MATRDGESDRSNPLVGISSLREFVSTPPELLAVAFAVLGYDLSIQLAMRFVANHLVTLGASVVAVGAFGSAGMLAGLVVPYLSGELPDGANDRLVFLVLGTLSVSGLMFWLAAPELAARSTGQLGPGWLWVLIGLVLIHLWKLQGVATAFDAARNRLPYEPLATGLESDEPVRRFLVLLGIVPIVALFVFLPFVPGFHVLVALGAALGFTAVIAQVAVVDQTPERANHDAESSGLDALGERVAAIPDAVTPLLVGDFLAQFAVGMLHLFLVLYVVRDLVLDGWFFGLYLSPPAVFAVLVGVEAATALVGIVPGEELLAEFGARSVLGYSLFVTAAVPFLLVVAPHTLGIVVLLFALYGTRFFALPARETLLSGVSHVSGSDAGDAYRTVRNAAVVPSALVGGVLYMFSPDLLLLAAAATAGVGYFAYHRVDELPPHLNPFNHA